MCTSRHFSSSSSWNWHKYTHRACRGVKKMILILYTLDYRKPWFWFLDLNYCTMADSFIDYKLVLTRHSLAVRTWHYCNLSLSFSPCFSLSVTVSFVFVPPFLSLVGTVGGISLSCQCCRRWNGSPEAGEREKWRIIQYMMMKNWGRREEICHPILSFPCTSSLLLV